ncbi:hypothetical protein CC77DRAFT_1062215 [Alternaria alternata]|uniref:Rhodopsin domain-containing protein n=1 Tax=Alternaria alternata TaxID=5599 RepID=A0A177DL29_ALTAL|nr:hypothetical protein CC77DRAFT_1062215 [Alternaria alternata]OAG19881.1 hypothetical protein CC77DRAFT_1062215 [Alternaria alternata]
MSALYQRDAASIPDRGPALVFLMWALTFISFVTVVLRFIFRARKNQIGWDDIFMGTTWMCFVGWSVVLTLYANRGGCQHIWDVEKRGMDNLTRAILLNWTSQIFGIVGVASGKISISALLLNIMRDMGWTWQRIYLWSVTIIFTSLVAISCSLLTFLQCRPPQRLWDPRIDGTCLDPKVMAAYGIFTGSFYTFADASLAMIPLTVFWKLRISVLQRIQLCIVFGLNILTSVCSGIKTRHLSQLGNRTDLTWATYDIFVWVTAELFLLVVCGTVPTLYPLLRWIQSLCVVIRRKVLPRSVSNEDPLRQSDEVLTIGKIRMRLKRQDTAMSSNSESQASTLGPARS